MHLTCSALGDDTCSSYRQCPLDAQSLFQKASCTSADAARSHLRRIASMSLEIWCPDNVQNVFKQQIVSSKNIPHPPCLQALPLQTIFSMFFHSSLVVCSCLFWSRYVSVSCTPWCSTTRTAEWLKALRVRCKEFIPKHRTRIKKKFAIENGH